MTLGEKLNQISGQAKNNGFIVFSFVVFWLIVGIFAVRLWNLQINPDAEITIGKYRADGKITVLKGIAEKRNYLKNSSGRKFNKIGRRGKILDRNGIEIANSTPNDNEKSQSQWKREYSYRKSAPIIGYVKKDFYQNGEAGIEKAFNDYLAGEIGYSELKRDGKGKLLPQLGKMRQKVKDGNDVHLTLDLEIQKIVDEELERTIKSSDAKGGMAIVMNPNTGEIYAMASFPTFDPVVRNTVERNKAISENYEPGSIFKTITFASAFNEGLITPQDSVDCLNGTYEIPNERPIKDDHKLGVVTYLDAYKYSSNIASLKIVKEKLGNKLFFDYCEKFGIGNKTGLGFAEEEKGILNHVNTWQPRDALSMAFGNSVSVTLIQMAVMTSAIANGGWILKPYIHKKITAQNGKIILENEKFVIRQAISAETAQTMRHLMSDVVEEGGTGRAAFVEGLNIGGKTGTSKKVENRRYLDGHYWASFTGIAPIDKPAFVVCVSIDDPRNGRYGGPVAGACVAKILRRVGASPKINLGKEINLLEDTAQIEGFVKVTEKASVYPNFVSSDLQKAKNICKELKIDVEIQGNGSIVIDQKPKAGSTINDSAAIITLFTDSVTENETIMPNLVGKDINIAIDMLSARGIFPEFIEIGAGKVKRQSPAANTVLSENESCSLFVEKGVFSK